MAQSRLSRSARTALTRSELLEVAERRFYRDGYHGTTLAAMSATFLRNAEAGGIPMEVMHRVAAMASGGATGWVEASVAACAAALASGGRGVVAAVALVHARAQMRALAHGIVYKDAKAFDAAVRTATAVTCSRGTVLTGEPEIVAIEQVGNYAVRIGFDNGLAHRIEAGSDIFLMPSRYEPCGLNQIYSLRYGTVPVVRATGGLDDTIDEGTGFKFWEYSGPAFLGAVRAAAGAFSDRAAWQETMRRGMHKDFSWKASATLYSALYRRLLGSN